MFCYYLNYSYKTNKFTNLFKWFYSDFENVLTGGSHVINQFLVLVFDWQEFRFKGWSHPVSVVRWQYSAMLLKKTFPNKKRCVTGIHHDIQISTGFQGSRSERADIWINVWSHRMMKNDSGCFKSINHLWSIYSHSYTELQTHRVNYTRGKSNNPWI